MNVSCGAYSWERNKSWNVWSPKLVQGKHGRPCNPSNKYMILFLSTPAQVLSCLEYTWQCSIYNSIHINFCSKLCILLLKESLLTWDLLDLFPCWLGVCYSLAFFFNLHYMYAYIHRCAHNWFLSIYPLCNCYHFISRLWQLALFSDILLSFIHLDAHSSCLFIFIAIYSMWLSQNSFILSSVSGHLGNNNG